jgi:CheY-like chemotaxis protein
MTEDAVPGHQVLVVDDEQLTRDLLLQLLESRGYSVASCANGREAVEYLRTHRPPRLILLDLLMPVMSGWELRDHMLTHPEWRNIPVAILSALEDVPKDLKFVAYIGKPLDFGRLFAVVTEYCD